MKVIDLCMAMHTGKEVPKEVFYKYRKYTYNPFEKEYYREDCGCCVSLFLDAKEEDIVYFIEDTPKEDKKIAKVGRKARNITNQYLKEKLNEIIDKINGGINV